MGPVEASSADGPPSPQSGSGGRRKPFLIGVAGGTASGKSTVCERIIEEVTKEETGRKKQIVSLSQDSFYRELDAREQEQAERGMFNFDHPDAIDEELMLSCLTDIREGRNTRLPLYDYKKNARVKDQYILVEASDVVLFEGILVFYFKEVIGKFDLKLFVDTDDDTRLARRVLRDIEERGRNLEHVLHQYTELVKPAFEEFCLPTKKHADVIIPRGADNTVAISLVANHIKDIIDRRSGSCESSSWAESPSNRSRANSDSLGR